MRNCFRYWLYPALFLLCCGLLFSGSLHGRDEKESGLLTADERQWLARHADDIVLAPTPNYPPVDFFNEHGEHSGIAADIFALIENRLGVTFTRKQLKSWHEIVRQARERTIDITTIAQKTPEREKFWRFTRPYLEVPTVIVARKEGPRDLSLEDLNNLDVAIVKGYAIDEYIDRHHPGLTVTAVPDDLTGLQKLSFGEFDAMIADLPTASYLISEWGITNLRIAGNTDHQYQYAIACRKDWPVFHRIIDKALADIAPEKRKAVINKWISMDRQRFPWTKAAFIIGVLVLFLAGFFIWNRTLQRAVRHRTRALERSENKFKALFDASPYAIMVADLSGKYRMVNAAFETFSGYNADEALGRTSDELGIFADPCIHDPHRQKFWADGRLESMEIPFKAADGTAGVIMYSCRQIRFDDRPAILSIAFDISENKRAQQALRDKEQQLRGLAAHLPGLVYQFCVSPDGHWEITYVSEGSEEILGISYEPEGFFERFQARIDPRDLDAFVESIQNAVAAVSNWEFEGRFIKPSGEFLWFRGMSSPFQNGDTLLFNGIILDITHQKQTEEQLRHARHMESVGRLAAGVAHDFNNMLSPILGYSEMLLREFASTDKRYARLQQIFKAAERARNLTHQLLAYGRKQTLEVKPVDLNTLITEMQ
ncbi:MAG: PAS domain S-box protein, partial [Thermodesulfobacteriota bacterium]